MTFTQYEVECAFTSRSKNGSSMKAGELIHKNCRNVVYCRSNIKRFTVPENFVPWSTLFPDYTPVQYESSGLHGKPWADPSINDDKNFHPNWNQIDGQVNRISYCGDYDVNDKYPLNPFGRTGIIGRGLLGRWGPNHAADSLVTRWSQGVDGNVNRNAATGKKILQMIAIQRKDNHMWAMPGGMVDGNETPLEAAKREFREEALHKAPVDDVSVVTQFFDSNANKIYAGYVDDPRNTDNAWMETVAFNFHDETGVIVKKLAFKAGDDAKNLKWIDLDRNINLYASHRDIIQNAVKSLDAHW